MQTLAVGKARSDIVTIGIELIDDFVVIFVLNISVSKSGECLMSSRSNDSLQSGHYSSGTSDIICRIDLKNSHQLSLRQTVRLTMLT